MHKWAVMLLACKEQLKADIGKPITLAHPSETSSSWVQTVEWFQEHQAEREAQLAKCNSNPGELATTPNCINASRAASAITWEAKGGIKVAPLTAEELKKQRN